MERLGAPEHEAVSVDRDFAAHLLRCIDDPDAYGPHLVFNEFWATAPQAVIDRYVALVAEQEELGPRLRSLTLGEPLAVDDLRACPAGSLGRTTAEFIASYELVPDLAPSYRSFHEELVAEGRLDRMPEEIRTLVVRGFQVHDYLHAVTGIDPSLRGEITLQAFCMGQMHFPYFGIWMSVTTSHIAFVNPDNVVMAMDAISHGWQLGRQVGNLQLVGWEDHVERPLVEVRAEFGVHRDGLRPLEGWRSPG